MIVVRGYGRASTDKQVISLDQQESVIRDAFNLYKRIRPGWADAEWGGFFSEAETSRDTRLCERPVGSILLATTNPGDVIMAAKMDRIFANVIDACEIIELLDQRKFSITILDADIDLSNEVGRCFFKCMAAFAQMEVERIRRRCREAAAYRKKNGMPHGSRCPIGWRVVRVSVSGVECSRFAPDEKSRALSRRLLALRTEFPGNFREFTDYLNEQRIRNSEGRRWNEPCAKRWVDAAIADFPLPNGEHVAAPIPPDAEPVKTLPSNRTTIARAD